MLVGLAEGTIELPPKPAIHPRPDAFVNTMPAYVGSLDGSGVKLVSVFPGNRARGLPAISAIVIVLDSETGLVRGLLGATALTACRTAAASAACAARLAPAAPGHVAITGAGVEARTHLLALEAQGYAEIVVWDHRAANIEALRAWAAEHAPSVTVGAAESASAAAEGAAIVVTGIPIGAEGGRIDPAALRPDVLALPIDYSTSIAAETANGGRAAAQRRRRAARRLPRRALEGLAAPRRPRRHLAGRRRAATARGAGRRRQPRRGRARRRVRDGRARARRARGHRRAAQQ